MSAAPSSHHFRAFGLTVRAMIALPELIATSAAGAVDVDIVMVGTLPAPRASLQAIGASVLVDATEFRLDVPGTAQVRVCDGNRIEIVAAPDHDPAALRAYLLGTAFGALLLQRGLVPLHASAIEIGGRAVAFTGMSGAGKSTLALQWQRRGATVLSDDLCALGDATRVSPGVVRLKLWDASLAHVGRATAGLERVAPGENKFHVPPTAPAVDRVVPLGAIMLLDWSETDQVSVTPLHGAAAARALVRNTYRGVLVDPMGIAPAHFARCVALARRVPVFTLTRPRRFAALDATVDAVIAALPLSVA